MNKKTLKSLIIIVSAILTILLLTTISNAASLSISTSKSTVSPGETFTVTVSVSGGAGNVSASVSNGTGGKTEFLDNNSFSFSCTAGSSGSVTIRASGTVADYTTELDENKSASKSVTISTPTVNPPVTPTKSNNANLSNLGITPNDFSGFKAANTSYSVTVPYTVSSIQIYASKGHSAQTIAGTGTKALREGSNTFDIKVTAEDGTTKTYKITVTRLAKENEVTPPVVDKPTNTKIALQSLSITNINMNELFNPNTLAYTANVEENIDKIEVIAQANIPTAKVEVQGADNIQVGENVVKVIATAEDGTQAVYTITVVRGKKELALQTLKIAYKDKEGKTKELKLTPEFIFNIYEYKIEGIENSVNKLEIEALANLENAKVEIEGSDKLKVGKNTITIKVTLPTEVEGEEPETITYTIEVTKKAKEKEVTPTIMGRIQNFFKGINSGVGAFISTNSYKIMLWSLAIATTLLAVLSIYIIFDYTKYQKLLENVKKLTKANTQTANLETEETNIKQDIETKI